MSIQGFLFDLDGTIGDTLPVCYAAFREVFREYLGRNYSDEEVRALFGPTEEGIIRDLVPDRCRECLGDFYQAYERAHDRCPLPFPGIATGLKILRRRGVRLAIVTGKGLRTTTTSLKVFGLDKMFDVVETGSPNGGMKPESMSRVLKKWHLEARQVASIGDSPSDIRAAQQVGATAFGAAWASTSDSGVLMAHNPTAVFRQVDEFLDWIDANAAGVGFQMHPSLR